MKQSEITLELMKARREGHLVGFWQGVFTVLMLVVAIFILANVCGCNTPNPDDPWFKEHEERSKKFFPDGWFWDFRDP